MQSDKFYELQRLNYLTKLLDEAIPLPGTRLSIGLDGIIGLIPGVGDAITTLASFYIIYRAKKLGVPERILRKMGRNVLIDFALGVIPIVGDAFDVIWKANRMNMRLLEKHLHDQAKIIDVHAEPLL